MNDMKEKAMGAVKAFLERKGYEIVDEAWQGRRGSPATATTTPTPRSASTRWR